MLGTRRLRLERWVPARPAFSALAATQERALRREKVPPTPCGTCSRTSQRADFGVFQSESAAWRGTLAHIVLYRKWRPQGFSDVVGQRHVVQALRHALERDRVGHAYLFAGPRGTGKTSVARLLAKGLNCEEGPAADPCGRCGPCRKIAAGSSVDTIEIDAASNRGIDEIRDLRDRVRYAPTESRRKVYIIDEVHMLTNEAFNALLKVLEEPPEHVVFIFATTEPSKVPETILSRCQRFPFRRFSDAEVAGRLQEVAEAEGLRCEPDVFGLIARFAEGGMRDALAILEQCAAFAEDVIDARAVADVLGIVPQDELAAFVDALIAGDAAAAFGAIQRAYEDGRDLRQFCRDVIAHLRACLLLKASGQAPAAAGALEAVRRHAEAVEMDRLLEALELFAEAESAFRTAVAPTLPLEIAVVRWQRRPAPAAQAPRAPAESAETRPKARADSATAYSPPPPPAEDPEDDSAAGERPQPAEPGPRKDQSVPAAIGDEQAAEAAAVWDRLLETLRQHRERQAEAFLREGRLIGVEGRKVIVGYAPRHRFHQANMTNPKFRQPVERHLSKLLGRPVELEAVIAEGEVGGLGRPGPAGERAERPAAEGRPQGRPAEEPEPPRGGPDGKGSMEGPASQSGAMIEQSEHGDRSGRVEHSENGDHGDDSEIDEPILRAALKLFGGKIIHVEERSREADGS